VQLSVYVTRFWLALFVTTLHLRKKYKCFRLLLANPYKSFGLISRLCFTWFVVTEVKIALSKKTKSLKGNISDVWYAGMAVASRLVYVFSWMCNVIRGMRLPKQDW